MSAPDAEEKRRAGGPLRGVPGAHPGGGGGRERAPLCKPFRRSEIHPDDQPVRAWKGAFAVGIRCDRGGAAARAGMTALYAARAAKRVLLAEGAGFGGQISHSPRWKITPAWSPKAAARCRRHGGPAGRAGGGVRLCRRHRRGRCPAVLRCWPRGKPGKGKKPGAGAGHGAPPPGPCGRGQDRRYFVLRGVRRRVLQGPEVAVVGGGDTALQDALLLADLCGRVTLIHRRGELRGGCPGKRPRSRPNVEFLLNTAVTAFESEAGRLTGLCREKHGGRKHRQPGGGRRVFWRWGQTPARRPLPALWRWMNRALCWRARTAAPAGPECLRRATAAQSRCASWPAVGDGLLQAWPPASGPPGHGIEGKGPFRGSGPWRQFMV